MQISNFNYLVNFIVYFLHEIVAALSKPDLGDFLADGKRYSNC